MKDFFGGVFEFELTTACEWLPANQFLFQLANLFLVLTYFVRPRGLYGLVQLRVSLTCAGLCFGLWGGAVICSLDCMLWNLAFAAGNACHLVYILARMWPSPFQNHYHLLIFEKVFEPVGLKRYQFRMLMLKAKEICLQAGEYYARQGFTDLKHISILADGCIEVLINGQPINNVALLEFLDSPEWLAMSDDTSNKYQVSLVASENSVIYQFQREDLLTIFRKDLLLKNIFDSIVGKDICKKLYSLHQTFLMNESSSKLTAQVMEASLVTYSAASLLSPKHQTSTPVPVAASTLIHSPWQQKRNLLLHSNHDDFIISNRNNSDIGINHTENTDSNKRQRSRSVTIVYPPSSPSNNNNNNNNGNKLCLASVDFSRERLLTSSKSSSLYKDDEDDIVQDFISLNPKLDCQKLIDLKETDL